MAKYSIETTKLDGVKLIHYSYSEDNRGYFLKQFEKGAFKELGLMTNIDETFESFSKHGVIRGLHYQEEEYAQKRYIRVITGEIYDVCVDIRPDSETFGKWIGVYLNSEQHKALYVERGFAHGFQVTSDYAIVSYICDGGYCPDHENGIIYSDKTLSIDWPINDEECVILSSRDAKFQTFEEYCLINNC